MSEVLETREGDVALLTLNRPDQGNSLSETLLLDLVKKVKSLTQDSRLKALVFTGAGPKYFCTGADLKTLGDKNKDPKALLGAFSELLTITESASVLTASFVNGDCIGGGLGIALSTDFILASPTARFGTPEITKGLFPYIISKPILSKLGSHRAKALCFGGRLWSAEEAGRQGIVSEVVESDFSTRAQALISLWNQASSTTLTNGKKCLNELLDPKTLVGYLQTAITEFRGTR